MKKQSIRVIAGVITFALGLLIGSGVFVKTPQIETPKDQFTVTETQPDCKVSISFPGISRELSKLRKFKNGYFPEDAFYDGWESADPFKNDWYGKQLRALKEKSLVAPLEKGEEVYRFTWLRSFHHPISVRIKRHGYSFELVSKETDGAGGYEPGKIFSTGTYSITQEDWCQFMALLDGADFWNQPGHKRDDMGRDGAQWLLEGVRDGRYHVVDKWSPETGKFREACLFLLKLTGRDLKTLGGDLY